MSVGSLKLPAHDLSYFPFGIVPRLHSIAPGSNLVSYRFCPAMGQHDHFRGPVGTALHFGRRFDGGQGNRKTWSTKGRFIFGFSVRGTGPSAGERQLFSDRTPHGHTIERGVVDLGYRETRL